MEQEGKWRRVQGGEEGRARDQKKWKNEGEKKKENKTKQLPQWQKEVFEKVNWMYIK